MSSTPELAEKQKFIEKAADFLQRNRKNFLIAAGIVVVLVAGLIVYTEIRKKTIEKAAGLIEQVEKDFVALLNIEADKTDERKSKEEAIMKAADSIAAQYDGTYAADRARVLLGNIAFQNKEWDKAADIWTALAKKSAESYLAPVALLNAAAAWEEAGKQDKALESLSLVLSTYAATFPEIPRTLFSLGRISEKLGTFDKAAGYYNDLIDKHPSSSWTKLARDRIIYLQVQNKLPK